MSTPLDALHRHLADLTHRPHLSAGQLVRTLVDAGLDALPLPGKGNTLFRWQALATVAAHDLSCFKLFEGHVDALATMAELEAEPVSGQIWAVWCSEPPDARVRISRPDALGGVNVDGRKAWCSGAASVDWALVSAWNEQGEPCLVAVPLRDAGVTVTTQGWQAVGMAESASVDVLFDQARGQLVGRPGSYVSRPGFWQGGAGIASGWYGAAAALGEAVRAACHAKGDRADAHQLAHVGHIDAALAAARALLHEVADWIDRHPTEDARTQALRARLTVEACANEVLQHAGRALGAGPLCKDRHIARLMADLPVFLRQSHAERDLAALGQALLPLERSPWGL
jgi:alkylation response protein AidB-like acyl-CoA dehydrogenase